MSTRRRPYVRPEVTEDTYVLRLTADELAALDAAIQGLAEDGEEAGEGDAYVTAYQKIREARYQKTREARRGS